MLHERHGHLLVERMLLAASAVLACDHTLGLVPGLTPPVSRGESALHGLHDLLQIADETASAAGVLFGA